MERPQGIENGNTFFQQQYAREPTWNYFKAILNQSPLQSIFQNKFLGSETYLQAKVGGALSCANYLESLQKQECKVSSPGTVMCQEGSTAITGYARGEEDETASHCEDVGRAVDWILDHCSTCSNLGCAIAGISLCTLGILLWAISDWPFYDRTGSGKW